MRRDEHGQPPFPVEPQQQFAHFDDALRIKPVDRFVEDEELGISEQSRGDPQPLAHTEREVLHLFAARAAQPRLFERTGNDRLVRADGHAAHFQILFGGERGEERGRFYNGADPAAHPFDPSAAVPLSQQRIFAAALADQPADDAHQRGFSRPVAPDETVDIPPPYAHRHRVHGGLISVQLCQAIGTEHKFIHMVTSLCAAYYSANSRTPVFL